MEGKAEGLEASGWRFQGARIFREAGEHGERKLENMGDWWEGQLWVGSNREPWEDFQWGGAVSGQGCAFWSSL